MRIVHVILSSRFAGSERHAIELAVAQAAAGHQVSLVLRRKAGQDRPDATAHRVDPAVETVLVDDWLFRWPARRDAARFIRRLRPEVAHAHLGSGCKALHGLAGVCARVATLHIEYKPQQHAPLDGLIAIAPWQLAAIPEPLRSRSTQIDNWTLPVEPAPDARARLRAAFGIGEDEFVFGALGRVEDSKGLDVLLEAFERAAIPRSRLVIVGQGGAWDALRARADGRVVMPGFTTTPTDWMQAFDVFVSAARSEPFGLVLLEAMQAGLPVLASASQGARHLAGVIGRPLVPVGDATALAAGLAAVHAERPARRSYPLDAYRIDAKLPQIEAFYRTTIDRLGLDADAR